MSAANLKLVKLVNGDVIIGYLYEENENTYRMENPIQITFVTQGEYAGRFITNTWLESDDQVFIIDKLHIIAHASPRPDLKSYYRSLLSSVVPQKSAFVIYSGEDEIPEESSEEFEFDIDIKDKIIH